MPTYSCKVCNDSFHRCKCDEPILMSDEPKHLAQADCEYDPLGKYEEAKKIPMEYVRSELPGIVAAKTYQEARTKLPRVGDEYPEGKINGIGLDKIPGTNMMLVEYEFGQVSNEVDPDGISANEPGSKLDAGKSPVTRGCLQYFPNALEAVAKVSETGAKKYTWKGWESVRDGERRYMDACGRHLGRSEIDPPQYDTDTGLLHLAQVAWNSLAALELLLRKGTPVTDPKKG